MNRNVAYRMKPVFELNTEFKTSSSLYKLKNLQKGCITTSSNPNEAVINDAVHDEEQILVRQEKLLSNLYQLQEQLSAFRTKSDNIKFSEKNTDNVDPFVKADVRDYVLNADPNYPPFALLWLPKLWKLYVNTTIHLHSSVPSIPENLKIFDSLKSQQSDSSNSTAVTFVWKDIGPDAQLTTSPLKYKTIRGEVNILRFFDYILNPDEKIIDRTRKDEILDLAHRLNYVSLREQQTIFTELQKHLANSKWFLGRSTFSIADAAVWSVLVRVKHQNALPSNLRQWIASCKESVGISVPV